MFHDEILNYGWDSYFLFADYDDDDGGDDDDDDDNDDDGGGGDDNEINYTYFHNHHTRNG